jgi:hypothetical protein
VRPTLDYSKSFLSEHILGAVDGFLLGDGCVPFRKRPSLHLVATLKYKEFADYLARIFHVYNPTVVRGKTPAHFSKKAGAFKVCEHYRLESKHHPDFNSQRTRWYPQGKKLVPEDVRITPLSCLLWFLGDGSVYLDKKRYPVVVLCTNSFSDKCRSVLSNKLSTLGIQSGNRPDGSIYIPTSSVNFFYDLIGWSSPVGCYSYKFEIPEYVKLTRSEQVRQEFGVSRTTFHRWLKASGLRNEFGEKHKFIYFNDEQIKRLREFVNDR